MFGGSRIPSSISLNLRQYEQRLLQSIEKELKELNKNMLALTEAINKQNKGGCKCG